MANQLGKRYICVMCGAEYIVTRGGDGELKCCGQAMAPKHWQQDQTRREPSWTEADQEKDTNAGFAKRRSCASSPARQFPLAADKRWPFV